MPVHRTRVAPQSLGSSTPAVSSRIAEELLQKVLGLVCGELIVEMPGRTRFHLHGANPGPQARIAIRGWRFFPRLLAGGDVGFAEAYMAGEWSSPNLVALLTLLGSNGRLAEGIAFFRTPRLGLRLRHALNRNSRRGSKRNIAAHYDLGNQFYRTWLDAGMTYSAARFSFAGQSLEEAQEAKLARVLELLDPQDGATVLEIGCGWGSLLEHILKRRNCAVTGITLSARQLEYGRRRLADAFACSRCDLRLQDYRDVNGAFDRVVSIEMLEAVGEAYWPTYFEKLRSLLRPGGVAVVQVITIAEDRFERYRRQPDFIQKYVFPGGMLPTKEIVEHQASQAGLRLVARECFGDSYARTLQEWNVRFQEAWPTIEQDGFEVSFKRMWEYYLAYCQVGFDTRALDVGLYRFTFSEE